MAQEQTNQNSQTDQSDQSNQGSEKTSGDAPTGFDTQKQALDLLGQLAKGDDKSSEEDVSGLFSKETKPKEETKTIADTDTPEAKPWHDGIENIPEELKKASDPIAAIKTLLEPKEKFTTKDYDADLGEHGEALKTAFASIGLSPEQVTSLEKHFSTIENDKEVAKRNLHAAELTRLKEHYGEKFTEKTRLHRDFLAERASPELLEALEAAGLDKSIEFHNLLSRVIEDTSDDAIGTIGIVDESPDILQERLQNIMVALQDNPQNEKLKAERSNIVKRLVASKKRNKGF